MMILLGVGAFLLTLKETVLLTLPLAVSKIEIALGVSVISSIKRLATFPETLAERPFTLTSKFVYFSNTATVSIAFDVSITTFEL